MKKLKRRFLPFFFFVLIICASINANSASRINAWLENIPGQHRGAITALLRGADGRILSAGRDGFLGRWDGEKAVDRFQLSPYSIGSMVLRPGQTHIAIIENVEGGGSRISAWDYNTKKNIFSRSFANTVSYINYSARGSFLIAAQTRPPWFFLIDSETGELIESPAEITGSITFAATGLSERVMITYISSGLLSYWDLGTGEELQRFYVPPNIAGGRLFGNYRFFIGFDSRGLLIIDAVTGSIIARDESIPTGRIFIDNSETTQFNILSHFGGIYTVNNMTITASGNLLTNSRRNISVSNISSVISLDENNIVFGTANGALWLSNRRGERLMDSDDPERIIAAAASQSVIAFITENGALGYIPLDFSLIHQGASLELENAQGPSGVYTHITADKNESRFLLWHSGRTIPMLITLSDQQNEHTSSRMFVDDPILRHPLRSAAIFDGNILLMNTMGMTSIYNYLTETRRFSQSLAGSQDAAFIDRDTVIIGRSVIGRNTPFLFINISTGETLHINHPAIVGTRVSSGESGTIYAKVVNQSGGVTYTSIIRMESSNPTRADKLVEYESEKSFLTMAESGGNFAYSLGREGTILKYPLENVILERSTGLPVNIMDGGRWFVILDREGGLTWHDNQTGELQAVFRLYSEEWVLEDLSFPDGKKIRGPRVRSRY